MKITKKMQKISLPGTFLFLLLILFGGEKGIADNSLQNINVTVAEEDSPLIVSPEFQAVQVGCSPKTIHASGGSDYVFSLIPRTTGIVKASCTNGSGGSCSLTEAITPNDVAELSVSSDGKTVKSLIVTYENYNLDNFFQCFFPCLFAGGTADQCAIQCRDELTSEISCPDTGGGDDDDNDDNDQFPPPPVGPPPPPSDFVVDFPPPPSDALPNPPTGSTTSALSCEEFPEIPTEESFYVRGVQDTAWQRAILSHPDGEIQLTERKLVEIKGTAEPHTEVFVFLSSADAEGFSRGTCFSAGKSDISGHFSLEINPKLLWGNIGDSVKVSSFFHMEETWDQIPEEDRKNPSAIAPLNLNVKGKMFLSSENSCEEICSIGIQRAHILKPETLDSRFLGKNFVGLEGEEIRIGRMPGFHTFSGGITGREVNDAQQMSRIIRKTLLVEALKRALLGNVNTNGIEPGLLTLRVDSLKEADRRAGNVSKKTQEIVSDLRMLLAGSAEERTYALIQLDNFLGETDGIQTAGGYVSLEHINAPVKDLLSEIFVENVSTEESWAENALEIIRFWTGSTEENSCLLEDDQYFSENFEGFSQEVRQCNMVFLLNSSSF